MPVSLDPSLHTVTLGAGTKPLLPMAMGGSWYDKSADASDLLAAIEAA
jgi:hypothetical protein